MRPVLRSPRLFTACLRATPATPLDIPAFLPGTMAATQGVKRSLADAMSPSITGPRPAPPAAASAPEGPPHLGPSHPCVVQVPADGFCLYHCAVAAADAAGWARTHAQTSGLAVGRAAQAEDRRRAEDFRAAVIARVRAAGRHEDADILGLPGAAGYPGEDELPFVAAELGGQVVLQHDELQSVHGHGSLKAHVRWVLLPGGPGQVGSGHFMLHQSWVLPKVMAVALAAGPGPDPPQTDCAGAPAGSGKGDQCAADTDAQSMVSAADIPPAGATTSDALDGVLGGLAERGRALVEAACALSVEDGDRGIVAEVQARRQSVRVAAAEEQLSLPRSVESLLVAASCVFDKRMGDLGVREHVLLLFIVDGDTHLRAHNGAVYQYAHGAWTPFEGLVSDSALGRIKDFLLHLEGLFRLLPAQTPRTWVKVQDAMLKRMRGMATGSSEDWGSHLRQACVVGMQQGAARGIRRLSSKQRQDASQVLSQQPGSDSDAEGHAEVGGGPQATWPTHVAQAIMRSGGSLLNRLQDKKVWQMFTEWCDSPSPRAPGLATPGACWTLSADGPGGILTPCAPSPTNNIYIFLNLPLAMPLQAEDSRKVDHFLRSTFWDNAPALKCMFAAMALALHGMNVDRAFWSTGPGGVGQSLTSHLMASAFGRYHAFVDMNIYFSDDEMRKQSELLLHALVTTGQEAPDTERRMREDVYKRHISADPVPCRLPYAILTKMVTLCGWKRFEMNETLKFAGTGESSFNSVFRRSLVVTHKARFVSGDKLLAMFPQGGSEQKGFFRRDPSLKEFLTSGRAGRAFMTMVLTFVSQTTPDSCMAILDDYAEGGDGGITRAVMRRACNLPADEVPEPGVHRAPEKSGPPPVTGNVCHPASLRLPADAQLVVRHSELVAYCLAQGKDLLTDSNVSRLPGDTWTGTTAKTRVRIFADLVAAGLWRRLPRRGKADPAVPVIGSRKGLPDLFPSMPGCISLGQGLPERIAGDMLVTMKSDPLWLSNNGVLSEHLCDQVRPGARGPGGLSLADREAHAAAEIARAKFQRSQAELDALVAEVRQHERGMGDLVASPTGNDITCMRTYHDKFEGWGRRYVSRGGAQNWSRTVRTHLLPRDVVDIDMKNAMVTLVAQVVPQVGLDSMVPASVMQPWDDLASDPGAWRSRVAAHFPGQGKSILLKVAHGGCVPDTPDVGLNSWLKALSTAARFLRWLAVSQLPDVHAWNTTRGKSWPENSTFAYWWQSIEDRALQHVLDVLTHDAQRVPRHVSLHFDGIMVSQPDVEDLPVVMAQAEAKILADMGLVVTLEKKEHSFFLGLVNATGTPLPDAVQVPDADADFWRGAGRTLPFHLAVVTGKWELIYAECQKHPAPALLPQRWRHWDRVLAGATPKGHPAALVPCAGLAFPSPPAAFLLHCQTDQGAPCSAAILRTPAAEWQVVVGCSAWVLQEEDLCNAFQAAVDAKHIVSFHVGTRGPGRFPLLDLQVRP